MFIEGTVSNFVSTDVSFGSEVASYVCNSFKAIDFFFLFREGVLPSLSGGYSDEEKKKVVHATQLRLTDGDLKWISRIMSILHNTTKNAPLSFRFVFKNCPLRGDQSTPDFGFDDSFLLFLNIASVCSARRH